MGLWWYFFLQIFHDPYEKHVWVTRALYCSVPFFNAIDDVVLFSCVYRPSEMQPCGTMTTNFSWVIKLTDRSAIVSAISAVLLRFGKTLLWGHKVVLSLVLNPLGCTGSSGLMLSRECLTISPWNFCIGSWRNSLSDFEALMLVNVGSGFVHVGQAFAAAHCRDKV